MRIVDVTVTGITPLLQHKYPEEAMEAVRDPRTGEPDWSAEAENGKYAFEDGTLYQPAEHFERSMTVAGTNFKIAGKRGKSFAQLVGSSVDVIPDCITHKIQTNVVDRRRVRVIKASVIRHRARLDEWELDFQIRLHDDQVPLPILKQILDYAGLYVGIGDYRPNPSRGKFGKFQVTHFVERKDEK